MLPKEKIVPSFVLFLLTAWLGHAETFSIDWSTLNPSGGTSTGGVYSVSGNIGQPDAQATSMNGGNFSVMGGFWSFLSVVQTPDAPLLSIWLTPTNTALISWPSSSGDFILQEKTNSITAENWTDVIAIPTEDGGIKFIEVTLPTGNRFYRLSKP